MDRMIVAVLVIAVFLAGCAEEMVEQDAVKEDVGVRQPEDSGKKSVEVSDAGRDAVSGIADTNQDKCYDTVNQIGCPEEGGHFFGQDAQYMGSSLSYRDNGDGTVSDLNTGLMWIKDAGEKGYYHDSVDAAEHFEYAGYDDWRVPTIKELYSLMDFKGVDPSSEDMDDEGLVPFIDADYFVFEYGDVSSGDRMIDSQWMTSNVYVSKVMGGEECFFGVNFADGRIKCYPTRVGGNNGYFLRFVRGEPYGNNEFADNGDGTVVDLSTGLMWQKRDNGMGVDWEAALDYCESLELAGNSDWRLPNAKELQYIVDYSRSPDITGSPAIDPVFETSDITNELEQKDYPYFWTSTTHMSHINAEAAAYISFGRAIGKMNGRWMDVHGAGAQRSDPKAGDRDDYPQSHGPQGDARRVYNHVRCVRGGASLIEVESEEVVFDAVPEQLGSESQAPGGSPPQEAIDACSGKNEGMACSFRVLHGTITGVCRNVGGTTACVP